MAVTVNATATAATTAASILTVSNANLTVAAGATALLAWVTWSYTGTAPASIVVQWDSAGTPQTMTQLTTVTAGVSTSWAQITLYGLLAPTTGLKTLKATWTNTANCTIDAIAFAGTATDTLGNAFKNANTNSGSGLTSSITATSAVGNINVASFGNRPSAFSAATGTGVTSVFTNNNGPGVAGARATGAASIAYSSALTPTNPWGAVCIDVSVPAAAAGRTPYMPWPQLAPILAQ